MPRRSGISAPLEKKKRVRSYSCKQTKSVAKNVQGILGPKGWGEGEGGEGGLLRGKEAGRRK